MPTAEQITVPRPAPGEYVIATCSEDGACAWITGETATLLDGGITRLLPGLLEEAEQRLRDEHPHPAQSR